MKSTKFYIFQIFALLFTSCSSNPTQSNSPEAGPLAEQVKAETQRAWAAYKRYAWGSDVLLPISKGAENWYDEPLYISPIDAYSTLKVMGLDEEAVRLPADCTVLSWTRIFDPIDSEWNARFLEYWSVTIRKKLYFQE